MKTIFASVLLALLVPAAFAQGKEVRLFDGKTFKGWEGDTNKTFRIVESAIVGGPKEIADYMEDMFAARGADGFVVAATHVPGAYGDFVQHVIPELQRRGLYHKDYAGATLRENLGLARPASRYATPLAKAA